MLHCVVVDGQGRLGTEEVQRTVSVLKGSLSPEECVDYLIINEGFGAISQLHDNVRVRFRPFMLTEAAFHRLGILLHEMQWQRAVASMYVGGDWRDEILPWDRGGAIARIKDIVAEHRSRDKVRRKTRPLESVPRGSDMDWTFHVWRQCPDLGSASNLEHILARRIRGRFAWIDAYGADCELIMAEVGFGFPEPVRKTLSSGLGSRLQDQPDCAFGRYCADAYGAVARSGVPTLEDIDAIITPRTGPPVRRRYSRLILPFRSSPEHTRLLGVSFENPAVDLRRAG